MRPLTPRQRQVLELLHAGYQQGQVPTVRELCTAFKISSPNGMGCHLKALERKEMIRHVSGVTRGWRLTDKAKALLASTKDNQT